MKTRRQITILTDVELITCIVQKGNADTIVDAAFKAGGAGGRRSTTPKATACGKNWAF